MQVEETVWYLEMHDASEVRTSKATQERIDVRKAGIACPSLNRFFYATVGEPWHWTDRLLWSDDQWRSHTEDPSVETWILYVEGTPAGYAELKTTEQEGVEISSFGLIPQFVGKGLGGSFLSGILQIAWEKKPHRIWLHTCSYDHPYALANYQARGFRLYDERTRMKYFPNQPSV